LLPDVLFWRNKDFQKVTEEGNDFDLLWPPTRADHYVSLLWFNLLLVVRLLFLLLRLRLLLLLLSFFLSFFLAYSQRSLIGCLRYFHTHMVWPLCEFRTHV